MRATLIDRHNDPRRRIGTYVRHHSCLTMPQHTYVVPRDRCRPRHNDPRPTGQRLCGSGRCRRPPKRHSPRRKLSATRIVTPAAIHDQLGSGRSFRTPSALPPTMLRRESGPPGLQPSGDMGKWSFVATDCMVTPLTPSCTRRHHGQAPKSVNLSSQSWNQCVCDCRTDFFKHSEARRTSAVRRGAGSGAAERGGGHRQSLAPAECGENRAPLLSHVYMPLLLSPYDLRVCPKCIRTHYVRTLPKPHDPETTCSEKLALPISGHKHGNCACMRAYACTYAGAAGLAGPMNGRPPAVGLRPVGRLRGRRWRERRGRWRERRRRRAQCRVRKLPPYGVELPDVRQQVQARVDVARLCARRRVLPRDRIPTHAPQNDSPQTPNHGCKNWRMCTWTMMRPVNRRVAQACHATPNVRGYIWAHRRKDRAVAGLIGSPCSHACETRTPRCSLVPHYART